MILDKISNSIDDSFIYLERYVNEGSPSGFSNITTSKSTAPRGENSSFDIFEVEFGSDILIESFGFSNMLQSSKNSILVHPDLINEQVLKKHNVNIINSFTAFPTASGRTVKVLGSDYFLKLTYNKYLGRTERQIAKKHILASLEITNDITEVFNNSKRSEQRFAFLKEVYGKLAYLPRINDDHYEWGFIVRESQPYPYRDENEMMIPCFSLFSPDSKSPDDLPLLIQLFMVQQKSPESFILEDLIFPIFESFFKILLSCGIGMEAHAQNVLVSINEEFKISRIIFRDMESAYRDQPLREFLNVNSTITNCGYKILNSSDYNYSIMHSFMFDFKLGEYLISKIIECANKYISINLPSLEKSIKEYNQQFIDKLPANYFPKFWYDYPRQLFNNNEKRPYMEHNSPKYRNVSS